MSRDKRSGQLLYINKAPRVREQLHEMGEPNMDKHFKGIILKGLTAE